MKVILVLLGFCFVAFGQTSEFERAVSLYNEEKYESALVILESLKKTDSRNAEVWRYVGLANIKLNDYKSAERALEMAVKLAPASAASRTGLGIALASRQKFPKAISSFSKAISLDPSYSLAYFSRGSAYFRTDRFAEAFSDAEMAIRTDRESCDGYLLKALVLLVSTHQNPTDQPTFQKRAIAITALEPDLARCKKSKNDGAFEALFDPLRKWIAAQKDKPNKGRDNADKSYSPLKILSPYRPEYTNEASSNGISGTVVLLVVFNPNGKIGDIFVVKPLQYGLTESAIVAAKQIHFAPEMRDAEPTATIKLISYSFRVF